MLVSNCWPCYEQVDDKDNNQAKPEHSGLDTRAEHNSETQNPESENT